MSAFDEIKSRVSFEQVARDHNIEFSRSRKALCPFHDDHDPSLSLHPSKEFAFCFVCNESLSDAIDAEYKLGVHPNRLEAAKAINERYGLGHKLNGYDERKAREHESTSMLVNRYCGLNEERLLKDPGALSFLLSKAITEEDIKKYKIGYVSENSLKGCITEDNKIAALTVGLLSENNGQAYDHFRNRITFPIWQRGRIVGIWARKFPDDKNNDNPKWLGLSTSEFMLHKPIPWAENLNCERCVIVEGITDALAFLKVGVPVCALLGKNISTESQKLLQKAKAKLYFALDPDEVGRKAAYDLARKYEGYILDLGSNKDPDDVLAEFGIERFKELYSQGIENASYYLDAVIEYESDYKEALKEIAKLEYNGEKEDWLKKLSKKTNISIGALKADLKKIEGQIKNEIISPSSRQEEPDLIDLLREPVQKIHPAMHYEDGMGLIYGTATSTGDHLVLYDRQLRYFSELSAEFSTINIPRPLRLSTGGTESYLNGDSINGIDVYNNIHDLLCAYIHFENKWQPSLISVWIISTYLYRCFPLFPYLWIQSPTKRCGKSRLLELVSELAFNSDGIETAPSEAVLFRLPSKTGGTLCWDEAEGLRDREKGERIEILNVAYRESGQVSRCVGDDHEVRAFNVFRPIVIAGTSALPTTVADRSLKIELVRKKHEDRVGRLQIDRLQPTFQELRDQLHIFALEMAPVIVDTYQNFRDELIPKGVDDRLRDGFEVLFSVAEGIVYKEGASLDVIHQLQTAARDLSGIRGSEEDDTSFARSIEILRSELENRTIDPMVINSEDAMNIFKNGGIEWVEKPVHAQRLMRNIGIKSEAHYIPGHEKRKRGYKVEKSKIEDLFARYCAEEKTEEKPSTHAVGELFSETKP